MKQDIQNLIDEETIEEIKSGEISDCWDLYNKLDYNGSIHEIVDSSIDVYYHNLRDWVVDNYNYVEAAMSEGLCEGVTDFHKLIQCGQYMYYREQANEAIEEIFEEIEGEE